MAIVRRTRADIDEVALREQLASARLRTEAEIEQDAIEDGADWTDEEFERAVTRYPQPSPKRVVAMREKLGLSRSLFARRFGFHLETIEGCEAGDVMPPGPATPLAAADRSRRGGRAAHARRLLAAPSRTRAAVRDRRRMTS